MKSSDGIFGNSVKEFKRGAQFVVVKEFSSLNEIVAVGTVMKSLGGGYSRYDNALLYEFRDRASKKSILWLIQDLGEIDTWRIYFQQLKKNSET